MKKRKPIEQLSLEGEIFLPKETWRIYECGWYILSTLYQEENHQNLDNFRRLGANPISLRDIALARIWQGANRSLSKNGSFVAEEIIYKKGKKPLIAHNPKVWEYIDACKDRVYEPEDYSGYTAEEYEEYLSEAEEDKNKNPSERRVIILPKLVHMSKCTPAYEMRTLELLKMLPEDKRHSIEERWASRDLCKDELMEIAELSEPYIHDAQFVRKLPPLEQFAIGLFKDYALPYALFNEDFIAWFNLYERSFDELCMREPLWIGPLNHKSNIIEHPTYWNIDISHSVRGIVKTQK